VGAVAFEETEADSRLMAFAGVLAKALPESGSNSRIDPREFAMRFRRLSAD